MTKSQNCTFKGSEKKTDFPHPRGHSIALLIYKELQALSEPENWRDSGWEILFGEKDKEISIVISEMDQYSWIMQIAPTKKPSLIMKAFGKKYPNLSTECFNTAQDVFTLLSKNGYSEFLWAINAFPRPESSTDKPISP
jgi:hypothetical protein